MAISPDLLEILACPLCKTAVALTADESGLECKDCGRIYPVRDDIPVMLVEEATVPTGDTPPGDADASP